MTAYKEFLKSKEFNDMVSGFDCDDLPDGLFDFQKAITKWAIKRGRAAVFADTGLGKTMIQVAWAEAIVKKENKQILIVAPLCVAEQTVNEAKKLNIKVNYVRKYTNDKIMITNYEMIEYFKDKISDGSINGIVLDESSILKHQDSKTRDKILSLTFKVPYKLSCTATPSPNDFMELGSQAEFLGVMTTIEMLSMFFIHDSGETSKWRLKGHGKNKFWEWMSTWCVYIKRPSDIGFSDKGYDLPELNIDHIRIGNSFTHNGKSLMDRHEAKRVTVEERVKRCVELVNKSKGAFIVWCHRNDESSELTKQIKDSVEVVGSDSIDTKHDKIMGFTTGKTRVLITKPRIAGFGMNWQHCNQMAFVGLSDSYEQIYQAIRRCWRFGQNHDVNVFFIAHAREGAILKNIKRKEEQAEQMSKELVIHMSEFQKRRVLSMEREKAVYEKDKASNGDWDMYLGDCVDVCKKLKDESIDYSIFSPPFASLYTYSNSDRDMGNSKTYEDFWIHFKFLIKDLFRVLRLGRNISVHCMNLPTSKVRDGYIGIRDFRGDIIKAFQENGFIYHSEVAIWKDPVVAMQRTKALGLLWKQIKKDSSMCRQGIPDYVVTFRKPGENTKPINHTAEEFPVDLWQHYASPCWMDIRQSNTLNGRFATENEDEKHICPLQLDVIYRCLRLWSLEGDVVLSPFAGIGSEGFVSIQMKRKFIGIELKKSYWKFAIENLRIAKEIPMLEYENGAKATVPNASINNCKLDKFI